MRCLSPGQSKAVRIYALRDYPKCRNKSELTEPNQRWRFAQSYQGKPESSERTLQGNFNPTDGGSPREEARKIMGRTRQNGSARNKQQYYNASLIAPEGSVTGA